MDRRILSLQRLQEEVQALRSRVSPSIQARRSIKDRLRSVDQHLEQVERKMKRLHAFCRYGVESYRHADTRLTRQAFELLLQAMVDRMTYVNPNVMSEEEMAYRTMLLAVVKATGWMSGTIKAYKEKAAREARELLRDPRLDSDRKLSEADQSLIGLLVKKFDQAKRTYNVGVMKRTKEVMTDMRQGRMTNEEQFWAPENPLNPGFAKRYGVDFSKIDYVIGGKIKPGSTNITRSAPGLGINKGGSIEAVTNPNSVRLNFFHMP